MLKNESFCAVGLVNFYGLLVVIKPFSMLLMVA